MPLAPQPAYACAIIHDRGGRLLLEHRPASARLAPGRLTCFGGRRRWSENARQTLVRELREELACRAADPQPAVDLYLDAAWIARFFAVPVDELPLAPVNAIGARARALPRARLDHPLVSPWHRAVLQAWGRGRRRVVIAA